MHVITHSLPPLLSAFILTVMNSFMTEQICRSEEKNEEEQRADLSWDHRWKHFLYMLNQEPQPMTHWIHSSGLKLPLWAETWKSDRTRNTWSKGRNCLSSVLLFQTSIRPKPQTLSWAWQFILDLHNSSWPTIPTPVHSHSCSGSCSYIVTKSPRCSWNTLRKVPQKNHEDVRMRQN